MLAVVSVLALITAVMTLALGVIVVYNGTPNQERFEYNRSRCLGDLRGITETMALVSYGETPTVEIVAAYTSRIAWAEQSCFVEGLLANPSNLRKVWNDREEGLYVAAVESGLDTPMSLVMRDRAYAFQNLVGDAMQSVGDAPTPGVWPWETLTSLQPNPGPSPTDRPWQR